MNFVNNKNAFSRTNQDFDENSKTTKYKRALDKV